MIPSGKAAQAAAAIPYLAILVGLYGLDNAWWAMGLYHAGALAYLLLARAGSGWGDLWRGWRGGLFAALAVPCAAGGPLLALLFPLARQALPDLGQQLAGLGVPRESLLAFCVYYCGVTPWLEEWLWRGRLGSASRWPDFSDLLFAGYHLLVLARFLKMLWLLPAFLILATVAWAWRRVYHRAGGLAVPVTTHLLADVSVMFGAFFLVK